MTYHWGRKHYMHQNNWWNLFDVTRCNILHHLNCQEFIWCNVFWFCCFGVVMVPQGLTHIHDAGIGDVLLCLCKLYIYIDMYILHGPKLMQSIASLIRLYLFDVTRCNGLHHKHRNDWICNNFRPNGINNVATTRQWFRLNTMSVIASIRFYCDCCGHTVRSEKATCRCLISRKYLKIH